MAAEVGPGGLLRFVGSGAPVHTLSPEDSAALEADPGGDSQLSIRSCKAASRLL